MTPTAPCAAYGCTNPVARLYTCGRRCADHTPARMAGKPEAPDPTKETR